MAVLRTWKAICPALGGMKQDTVRALIDEYKDIDPVPIVFLKGRPMSSAEKLQEWIERRLPQLNSTP